MIQLEFTLTADEVISLARRKQLPWMRRLYWLSGIMLVLLAAFALILDKWEGLLLFGMPMVLVFGIYQLYFPRLMKRQFSKLPSWGKPVIFVFEDTQIVQKSAYSESTFQWEGIRKAEELPDWFLLYTSPMAFITIPKRVFSSAEEEERFRALLYSKGLLPIQKG